jgi:predicted RNA polymerase sigma factor
LTSQSAKPATTSYFRGLRGTLLKELQRFDEAREALNCAIALAKSVAEAKLIRRELDRLA